MRERVGSVALSKDEYIHESVRLYLQIHANKIRIQMIIGIGGVCLGVFFGLSRRGPTATLSLVLLGLGILLLIVVALYPYEVRRFARKIADGPQNASFFDEVTYFVDEEGFEACDSRGVTSFVPWSTLVKKQETERATYLYTSQISFTTFPNQYPNEELRELVQRKIGHLPNN